MAQVRAEARTVVPAPAEQVFNLLADYRETRPAILPDAYSRFEVVEGGTGAGTVFTYRLRTARGERDYRMRVTEAELGRLLVEADESSSLVTRWTLTPASGGTLVTVETSWAGAGGVGGFFERLFAPKAVRGMHEQTLRALSARITG